MYKYNSVALIGSSGFVGTNLLQELCLHEEYRVTAFARSFSKAINKNIHQKKISDISEVSDWVKQLKNIDCIIHTAARVHVMNEKSASPIEEFRKVNVDATLNIARSAVKAGVKRFIFISSIKVNGEETGLGRPFSADDVPAPVDAYGISKLEAEIALRKLALETGLDVVIIRPVLVYGPGVKANFLNLIRLMEKGIPLPLASIGNKRSLVAIDNLVSLIINCINHPNAANQVFLVSDGKDVSTPELLRHVANALQRSALLFPFPTRLIELVAVMLGRRSIGERLCQSLEVDIEKTKNLLNWSPIVTLQDALQKTVEHYQGNQE